MTEFADRESLLAERFAQLTTADSGDWLDVRRRARRMRVRRTALLAAAVIAAALITAPALGLHRIVVDWLEAEPAPGRTQLQFLQLGVGAPPGMDPGVVPNSARKVTEVAHDGKVGVLWVAPTKRGGFCVLWTAFFGGGCVPDRASLPTHIVRSRDDVKPILLGLAHSGDPTDGGIVPSFSGHLLEPKTERLLVSYADGEEAEVPVVWVTPPIDAGFYAYWIPKEHRRPGHHMTAVTALDEADRVLARQTFQLTPPQEVERLVRLPDGEIAFLPRKAIVERARKLIDFLSESGVRVTLWVIPSTDGGRCYVFNRGSGCQTMQVEAHPLGAGLHGGGRPVLIGGEVSSDVTTYELHYEDGVVERLRPIEGFILHEISERHYQRGHHPRWFAQRRRFRDVNEITEFGAAVLAVSAAVFVALLGMRLADRLAVPYAAIFLVGAVLLGEVIPAAEQLLSTKEVERIAVVALMVILFHGGLHIGLRRFRHAVGPILALGIVGTFLTAAVVALAARYLLGFSWIEAGLIGAAIAPTDPAVTFSVFGAREVRGRSGTILEGEAGMNDPVGIALMIGMIELATADEGTLAIVVEEFAIQMALGLAVGVAGAFALLPAMRHIRLVSPALYPIRVLAGAGVIYGLAAITGGSGFLAVFVAGILLGDLAAPRKGEIEGFHASLAGLAEIAAFVALGLSIAISDLSELGVWEDGLALAVILAFVARPLAVGSLLLPARLRFGERLFVVWGGLKGAVPILLGALAILAGVENAERLYGIVFVVVLFSVIVQGATVPLVARKLRVPFRLIDHDLAEVVEFVVRDDAFARGRRLAELPLGERAWVGVLIRDGRPRPVGGGVVLEAGDRVHVYCQPEDSAALERLFAGTSE